MINIVFDIHSPVRLKGNIQAYPKKITLLTGSTGCGKTTLLYRIVGCERQGILKYDFFGKKTTPKLLLNQVSTVFQSDLLIQEFTLLQHLEMLPDYNDEMLTRAQYLMKEMHLFAAMDQRADKMSGGERQRFSIILALLKNPKLLVLDEPTSALDESTKHIVLSLLVKEIEERNIAVIMTSHDQSVFSYASYHIQIKDGLLEMNTQDGQESFIYKERTNTFKPLFKYYRFYYQLNYKKTIVSIILLMCVFASQFLVHHIFNKRLNNLCDNLNTGLIYFNDKLMDSDILVKYILDFDEVADVDYSQLDLSRGFTIKDEEYQEIIGVQNYFECDNIKILKEIEDDGAYINSIYAYKYGLDLGDDIILEQNTYKIKGILNNYHPLYAKHDGMQLFIEEKATTKTDTIVILLKNGLDAKSVIEKITQLDSSGSVSYADYGIKLELDYYSNMAKLERIINIAVTVIVVMILGFYSIKKENQKYKNYAYQLSNGISRSSLILAIIINELIISLITFLPVFILSRIYSTEANHWYLIMMIVLLKVIISVLPICSKNRYIKYLRSKEYKI